MANALILAGSREGGDPLAIAMNIDHKSLLVINGRMMLNRVADALADARFDNIAVSTDPGPVAEAAASLGLMAMPTARGPSDSVKIALDTMGAPMLVTTADHALLEPIWIETFLDAVPETADIAVLLARRETIERDAPGSSRTYLRFADGEWSGCNLFYLATPRARAALDLWRQVEADRKRPWRIVRRFGARMLLRYVLGKLTLRDAVAHLGGLAGVSVAVVESPFGLAAVDVDKETDLAMVRTLAGEVVPGDTLIRPNQAHG